MRDEFIRFDPKLQKSRRVSVSRLGVEGGLGSNLPLLPWRSYTSFSTRAQFLESRLLHLFPGKSPIAHRLYVDIDCISTGSAFNCL